MLYNGKKFGSMDMGLGKWEAFDLTGSMDVDTGIWKSDNNEYIGTYESEGDNGTWESTLGFTSSSVASSLTDTDIDVGATTEKISTSSFGGLFLAQVSEGISAESIAFSALFALIAAAAFLAYKKHRKNMQFEAEFQEPFIPRDAVVSV